MNEQNQKNTAEETLAAGTPPEAATPAVQAEAAVESTPATVSETESVPPAGDSQASSASSTPTQKNILIRNYAVATVVIALMGGGLWLALESQGRVETNFLGTFSSRSAVATVNGVKITREAYQKNREQVQLSAQQQGVDISDPAVLAEIDTQAVQTLINTELLTQEAANRGIAVSDEDIQARYDEIIEQVGGTEALMTRMTELSLTEEGLRADIAGELLIQALFAEVIDVTTIEVTDEEIQAVYEQVSAQQETDVAFEEVRDLIRSNLQLSKEQTLVSEYIESLRTAADIEIKV